MGFIIPSSEKDLPVEIRYDEDECELVLYYGTVRVAWFNNLNGKLYRYALNSEEQEYLRGHGISVVKPRNSSCFRIEIM